VVSSALPRAAPLFPLHLKIQRARGKSELFLSRRQVGPKVVLDHVNIAGNSARDSIAMGCGVDRTKPPKREGK
jgi:hypothetical protein